LSANSKHRFNFQETGNIGKHRRSKETSPTRVSSDTGTPARSQHRLFIYPSGSQPFMVCGPLPKTGQFFPFHAANGRKHFLIWQLHSEYSDAAQIPSDCALIFPLVVIFFKVGCISVIGIGGR